MAAPDTIYALSSGPLPAAIAIVRVSGPASGDVLRLLTGAVPEARRASLRAIRDPADGSLLDRALVMWFPAPHTATGEDLAELHLHGGRAVVAAVSRAIGAMPGVRQAEAGEFTRRAFLNGRMDLAEVEGYRDLLAAETEAQRRVAMRAAGGALGREVEAWRSRVLQVSAAIEAMLDFADEDDVTVDASRVGDAIAVLADGLGAALARPPVERLRDGVRVAIAGPPNVGKSTLLNALVGRSAAIVSPHAGTTRDVVEVPIALGGVPIVLLDSAGMRDTVDPIEAEGVARAAAAIAAADIVLWLGDDVAPRASGCIYVRARGDLPEKGTREIGSDVTISVHAGWGIDALVDRLLAEAATLLPRADESAFNERQRDHLHAAHAALLRCNIELPLIFAAEELRAARVELDAITGRAGIEDMLDTLFGAFCIGK